MEHVSFLFVVFSVIIVETETSLYYSLRLVLNPNQSLFYAGKKYVTQRNVCRETVC